MKEIKYQIMNFIFLVLLGMGVFWALHQIDNKVMYSQKQIVHEPTKEENVIAEKNKAAEVPLEENNGERFLVKEEEKPKQEEKDSSKEEHQTTQEQKQENNTKYQTLKSKLEALKEKKIIFEKGDSGEAVGKIQEFLNIYFGKNMKIDKDYGPTTKKLVTEFQKKELNGGDGRVGPNTLGAMIRWLEKQS